MSKQKQFVYTTCSKLVVFMYWTGKSMNNLLVDPRTASDNDLPVQMSNGCSLASSHWK